MSRVLRRKEVIRLTGLSASTIWRLERRGDFPARLQLGPQAVGWLEDEIHAWINARTRSGRRPAQVTHTVTKA
jgi:prophage regulatory protein